ncbi:MAG: hypothetical protein E7607_08555 [Ruminococcaceae bacterium]|nr:hypothetical protein [Oscillospiraceae bacterium]
MSIQNSRFLTALRYIIPLLLTVLWLTFIFGNSLKTGEQSSEQSGKVHEVVNDVAQSIGIEKPISEHTVRKSAHFLEFAVLGGLVCIDLWAFRIVSLKKKLHISSLFSLLSLPICAVFASIDELLQKTSKDRGPSVIDVLIDTSGAATATFLFILVFAVLTLVWKRTKAKKEEKSSSIS